jgi:hypothetical protein
MKKTIFVLMLLSIFSFCKKETTTSQGTWMIYGMTQCADPWQDDAYAKDKPAALKAYLQKQGITVLELKIETNKACSDLIACAACACASCLDASVRVEDKDIPAMEKLKFAKK